MEPTIYELLALKNEKEELEALLSLNDTVSKKYGLILSKESAKELMKQRNESLKKYHRVEFGHGILEKLIYAFCDSSYIEQDNYEEMLGKLQDIFYQFKNEAMDLLNDDELLTFMKDQFETVCFGDLEYLESTCLERFIRAVRAGYRGFQKNGCQKEYGQFNEEERWDEELYQKILKELFWG